MMSICLWRSVKYYLASNMLLWWRGFAVCSLKVVKPEELCSLLIILDFILKSAAGKKIFLKEVWYMTWSGIKTLWSGSWASERNHLSVKYLWMKSDSKYQGSERFMATDCHTQLQYTLRFPPVCTVVWTPNFTDEEQWLLGRSNPSQNAFWHLGRDVCYLTSLQRSNGNGREGTWRNWAC